MSHLGLTGSCHYNSTIQASNQQYSAATHPLCKRWYNGGKSDGKRRGYDEATGIRQRLGGRIEIATKQLTAGGLSRRTNRAKRGRDEQQSEQLCRLFFSDLLACGAALGGAPKVVAIGAVDGPEDVLDHQAPVFGASPKDHGGHIENGPEDPVLAVAEHQQYLCHEGGHGGEGIDEGLRVVGEAQDVVEHAYQDHRGCKDAAEPLARELQGVHLGVGVGRAVVLHPDIHAPYHGNKVEDILGNLAPKVLFGGQIDIEEKLDEGEDVAGELLLAVEHHAHDAEHAADKRDDGIGGAEGGVRCPDEGGQLGEEAEGNEKEAEPAVAHQFVFESIGEGGHGCSF